MDYELLRPVVGIPASRAAEHLVHDDVPGNVGARLEQNVGDAKAAIASAPHRLALDLDIERSSCQPMEGRGTVARWDPDLNRLQAWTSTQTSTGVRAAIAVKLELDLGQVDVITPDVGGGFGTKLFPYREYALAAVAAEKLRKPVKWVADRSEHFLGDSHGRDNISTATLAIDDKGKFLALEIDIVADMGAYLGAAGFEEV